MGEKCGRSVKEVTGAKYVLRCGLTVGALGAMLFFTSACQTHPELQAQVRELRGSLSEQEQRYALIQAELEDVKQEKAYIKEREEVLLREKESRRSQAESNIRNVRDFTEIVAGVVREASEKMDVWDYIGGELIPRNNILEAENVLLIDMENSFPGNGRLTGARVYAEAPARLQFCLIRPAEDGRRLTVVQVTEEYETGVKGIATWNFALPVSVREGDLIGLYVHGNVPIPYDAVGTGNVAIVEARPEAGRNISVDVPAGRHTKAFSFGVIGDF